MIAKAQHYLGVISAILCLSSSALAQGVPVHVTRTAELQNLSESLLNRDANDRQQAEDIARHMGIPVRQVLPGGRVLELQRFEPGRGPVFYITNNVDAADTVSTDEIWPGGTSGLNLDGSGMTVGEWDGGAIYAAHPDFAGRLTQVDGATEVSGHSTHVAGTLIGAGDWLVPEARGMAYAAHLDAYDWNSDTAEMAAAAAAGLLHSNHSYGIAAGWLYIGGTPPDTWWWIGGDDPSDVEDPNFGYYDTESQLWDQIAFDAPYYLIVKASGNDRSDIGPAPGELYTVIDQDGNFLFTSTLPRNADCAPAGYDCLPTHSVAKNVLTVGAVDDIPGGYAPLSGPPSVVMSPFSSWGPSDDGRIKPDLVGNGVFLMSTWPDSPYYAAAAGTSMAAPNVTGSMVLLQEHYQDLHGAGNFMRGATVKALAIHTADEAGDADGPDYAFGWGLLNTKEAAEVISEDGNDHQIIEGSLANGAVDSIAVNVSQADSVLSATLVWMDPPGTPVAPSLDPPDLMLVNDLDLRIKKGPGTYLPWVLDPSNPAAAATTGDNFRDNVEQVRVTGGGTGSYTVEVSHKGTLLNSLNQDYALIISVEPPLPTGSGLLIDEDFTGGLPAGWTIDTPIGIPWTINTPVPGDSRLDNGTGGTGQFAMVDNGYAYQTVTSLRTPVLDLSANTGAVLSFRSYYNYDTFESLNVDVSTDGGSGWSNVWNFQGFNNLPTLYTLDISGAIAGQSNVMIRFRFDSHGFISGDFWQVDNVQLEVFGGGTPLPGQAGNPSPANGATSVNVEADLSWTAGTDATTHDVYFGTNPSPGAGELQGNQAGTTFDPGTMTGSTTYYWRIDEVNATGTTAGSVWSFNTDAPLPLPGQAGSPSPTDSATGVNVEADLSWTAGSDATSHDVYFGTNPVPGAGELQGNQAGTTFDPGTMTGSTTYFWRIDEVNTTGTTTGTVWSFSTDSPPQPPSIHLADLSGSPEPILRGRWNAIVTVTVEDEAGAPTAAVLAEGDWSNGATGSTSCTTDGRGQCTLQKNNLKGNVASVDFTISNLVLTGYDYESSANEVPAAITVFKDAPPNLLPNAVNDSFSTPVDTVLGENVLANDDQGDAPATVTAFDAASVSGFAVTMDANTGDFTYTPTGGFNGNDSFGYTITDNNGDASAATVDITVGTPNLLPNAVDDDFSTPMDTVLNENVLSNDDQGDTPATVTAFDAASVEGFAVTMDVNTGDFSYSPNGGFTGADSFVYTITDNNGDSSNATVNLTVSGGGITVGATPYKVKGVKHVDLTWSGAASTNVQIWRDGILIITTLNDGFHTDNFDAKGGGSYLYDVCEASAGSPCGSASADF